MVEVRGEEPRPGPKRSPPLGLPGLTTGQDERREGMEGRRGRRNGQNDENDENDEIDEIDEIEEIEQTDQSSRAVESMMRPAFMMTRNPITIGTRDSNRYI